ncbi:MAG TPA: EI24 domain-containing protein [Naasia sp.]|jgi:CysZ protein
MTQQAATDPGLRSLAGGVGDFFRGFRLWGTSFRLMALGALPALLVGIVVVSLLVLLGLNLENLAGLVTPFADDWSDAGRSAVRLAAGAAILVLGVVAGVLAFTALTLAVGDPFYERIWLAVEGRIDGWTPPETLGFWASMRRGLASGLRLGLLSVLLGITVFLVGLIPLVGGVVAFAVGVLGGGSLLARELVGRPFEGRELAPAQQAALRRLGRPRMLGFGVAVYLVFLLPLGAVFAMPAAVAGSTVLARRILDAGAVPPRTG